MSINKKERTRKAIYYTLVLAFVFFVSYLMYYKETLLPKNSDFLAHMNYALSLDKAISLSHCGWQLICWAAYACLPITPNAAAAFVTAAANTATAGLVFWLFKRYLKEQSVHPALPAVLTAGVMMAGPLYLRFYNAYYYAGQGTPNVWHNPTMIMVKPFMILITVMTIDYWAMDKDQLVTLGKREFRKKTVYEWLLAFLLFFSTLIKPSFLMCYAPVCGILIICQLIKARFKNFWKLVVENLYFLPSFMIFFWQFLVLYVIGGGAGNEKGGGIEIAFFKIARRVAPSVTVSLLLKMMFPFLIILIWRKVIFSDKLFRLVFAQFLVGLATTWTFAETGSRASHGNFGWGNLLAASFLWIFCVVFYGVQLHQDREKVKALTSYKIKYGVPACFLLWHVAAGCCYYYGLLGDMTRQL